MIGVLNDVQIGNFLVNFYCDGVKKHLRVDFFRAPKTSFLIEAKPSPTVRTFSIDVLYIRQCFYLTITGRNLITLHRVIIRNLNLNFLDIHLISCLSNHFNTSSWNLIRCCLYSCSFLCF